MFISSAGAAVVAIAVMMCVDGPRHCCCVKNQPSTTEDTPQPQREISDPNWKQDTEEVLANRRAELEFLNRCKQICDDYLARHPHG
jgi:hypothetical protein